MTSPVKQFAAGWQRFWFEPQETSSLALFRIAFGLLSIAWTATLGPNLFAFFGPHGIAPQPTGGGPGSWGVLDIWTAPGMVVALFVVTLLASVALTLGLFTRIAAVVVWLGIVSFEQRNGLIGNSGDGLVRNLAFLLVLAPSGAALSLDRLRTARDRFWEFPARAPWALRLIQIQISVGYLSAVWHKSGNQLWRDGTAVSYALRIQDIDRAASPAFITHSVLLTELLTYGTLALELALGVLVWNRALRPWVLLLGITLHLSIDVSLLVGFFSLAMLAAYLTFVPAQTAARVVLGVRDRLRRLRRRPAEAGEPSVRSPHRRPAAAAGEVADAG
jgi:hypothetical protein